jgi:hypothetical protein
MGLAGYGLAEVLLGISNRFQGLQVVGGVNGLCLCRSPKEPGCLGEAVIFRLGSEGRVLPVRLRLSGKGRL